MASPHVVALPHVVLPVYTSVGLNNYKSELRVSALVAAASGRTLCLPDFTDGKTLTTRGGSTWDVPVSAVYDLDVLAKFVAIAPASDRAACPEHEPQQQCEPATSLCGKAKNRSILEATASAGRLREHSSRYAPYRCLAMWGCQWIPLVVPTLSLALWQHLLKPRATRDSADEAIATLFHGEPFVALHWRFEEKRCTELHMPIGLCMRTTTVGTRAYPLDALVGAAQRAKQRLNVRHLFLASDGADRGGDALLEAFRKRTGALELLDCYSDDEELTSHMASEATARSEIEQEIVSRAAYALGSSRSSWFFEAALSMSSRRHDVRGFEVALEAEAGLYASCPECHAGLGGFPSIGPMEGLSFGFLGEEAEEGSREEGEGSPREQAPGAEREDLRVDSVVLSARGGIRAGAQNI